MGGAGVVLREENGEIVKMGCGGRLRGLGRCGRVWTRLLSGDGSKRDGCDLVGGSKGAETRAKDERKGFLFKQSRRESVPREFWLSMWV